MRAQAEVPSARRADSLALSRPKASSGAGAVLLDHSCSIMASLPVQDQVEHPAPPDVRPWPPEVAEDLGVRAARLFERVGEDGQVLVPALVVDGPRQLLHPAPAQPSRVKGRGA